MPILAAEPSLFPDELLTATVDAHPLRRWYAMHTKPRQEKSLARDLRAAEVPFYVPLATRRFRLRGRLVQSYVPVFPGYAFVLATAEERLRTLATRRVVRSLDVPDQAQLWHDLRQIERLLASGAPIMPEDKLKPGCRVLIKSGPLQGLQGTIIRTETGRRFTIQVNFIQRGASVMLDDYVLEEVL